MTEYITCSFCLLNYWSWVDLFFLEKFSVARFKILLFLIGSSNLSPLFWHSSTNLSLLEFHSSNTFKRYLGGCFYETEHYKDFTVAALFFTKYKLLQLILYHSSAKWKYLVAPSHNFFFCHSKNQGSNRYGWGISLLISRLF